MKTRCGVRCPGAPLWKFSILNQEDAMQKVKAKKSKKELKKLISVYLERNKVKGKLKPIFSGDESKNLWESINKITKIKKKKKIRDAAWGALYTLGCRCQELETRVDAIIQSLAVLSYPEETSSKKKEEKNVT
jgi:hypothetical protein